MAKRVKTVTKRTRIPNNHVRICAIVPFETANRIAAHCDRTGTNTQDFHKKAIYDALPVHYEVTEEWTFPFGKYTGETAGTVKQLDPGYIAWCKKTIVGFMYMMEPDDVSAINTGIDYSRESSHWRTLLHDGEHLQVNNLNKRVWAYRLTQWGQRTAWRKLGEYID